MNIFGLPILVVESLPDDLWVYISIALISSVKFFWGVVAAILKPGFGFWDIVLAGGGGAWLGTMVFIYFGTEIRKWVQRHFKRGKPMSFARRRQIYMFWKKYGLFGVVVLIPLISPMVSVGIAVSFQEKPIRIVKYMTGGIVIYTLLLALFKEAVIGMVG